MVEPMARLKHDTLRMKAICLLPAVCRLSLFRNREYKESLKSPQDHPGRYEHMAGLARRYNLPRKVRENACLAIRARIESGEHSEAVRISDEYGIRWGQVQKEASGAAQSRMEAGDCAGASAIAERFELGRKQLLEIAANVVELLMKANCYEVAAQTAREYGFGKEMREAAAWAVASKMVLADYAGASRKSTGYPKGWGKSRPG
jgi:hypothetical protein